MSQEITFRLNKRKVTCTVEDSWTLLYLLREKLKLTGTKQGCGTGDCGACTVLVDGKSVNACLFLAALADGRDIMTIEGVEEDGEMSVILQSFVKHGAIQCGFCSPGMIMSAKYIIDKYENPGDEEIRRGISGNLCRCTGYQQIVEAIKEVKNM